MKNFMTILFPPALLRICSPAGWTKTFPSYPYQLSLIFPLMSRLLPSKNDFPPSARQQSSRLRHLFCFYIFPCCIYCPFFNLDFFFFSLLSFLFHILTCIFLIPVSFYTSKWLWPPPHLPGNGAFPIIYTNPLSVPWHNCVFSFPHSLIPVLFPPGIVYCPPPPMAYIPWMHPVPAVVTRLIGLPLGLTAGSFVSLSLY